MGCPLTLLTNSVKPVEFEATRFGPNETGDVVLHPTDRQAAAVTMAN